MMVIKIALTTMSLVVFTIVQCGSSETKEFKAKTKEFKAMCVSFITKESCFKKGETNKIKNFKYAFSHLSLGQIKGQFRLLGNDSEKKKLIKTLKHDLIVDYFLDLFYGHTINVKDKYLPEEWCTNRVKHVLNELSERTSYPGDEIDQMQICEDYTTNYLFKNKIVNDPNIVFRLLYENWSNEKLRQYENQVPLMGGHFRSVEKFCNERGYKLVMQNGRRFGDEIILKNQNIKKKKKILN